MIEIANRIISAVDELGVGNILMKALVHTKPFLMEYKNVKKPRLLKIVS